MIWYTSSSIDPIYKKSLALLFVTAGQGSFCYTAFVIYYFLIRSE